mmetsp:Transcript_17668/g.27265  ORF Transcript_17668/g.27265 Transcript_17668/m.27265 type:complete len:670 (-) Transcript_17668:1099-3108(-)
MQAFVTWSIYIGLFLFPFTGDFSVAGFSIQPIVFSKIQYEISTQKLPKVTRRRAVSARAEMDQHEMSTSAEITKTTTTQKRVLGSQELLFKPRQYSINGTFPMQSHVAVVKLSKTPSIDALTWAINEAIRTHPMMRAHIEGDGQPTKHIDLNKMVREGNPNPETFVCRPSTIFNGNKVVTVVNVPPGQTLDQSWQRQYLKDLDNPDGWCSVHTGPLWKMELHREAGDNTGQPEKPCALLISLNHVISDQGSLNVVIDQIVSDLKSYEEMSGLSSSSMTAPRPAVEQDLPVSMEESVLGKHQTWSDLGVKSLSFSTLKYITRKSLEGLRWPVFLPDSEKMKPAGGGWYATELFHRMAPGGQDPHSSERKSTIQYRTISEDTTTALLDKCRERGLSISSALTAAVALTCSDYIDSGVLKKNKKRTYKLLQSLDMRRFGAQLDKCETLACQAGSMDLMIGKLRDRSGEKVRLADTVGVSSSSSSMVSTNNPEQAAVNVFWDVASDAMVQTKSFLVGKYAQVKEAVRVFDFGMQISEINKLVDTVAQSRDMMGRYYSGGITNAGVYQRQKAVLRKGQEKRENIKVKHGKYEVLEIYYGTSHARAGCLFPVSCLTVGGKICCNFNPAMPIVNEETNKKFADSFVQLLDVVAGVSSKTNEEKEVSVHSQQNTVKY